MASTPKPLIGARDRSVGGALRESRQFFDNPDMLFVPGYSDVRRQIDADLSAGRTPSKELSYRLHWSRHARPNGGGDGDAAAFMGRGYVAVTKDDLAKYGITQMQPHWQVGADGTIRLADTVLMACPAEQAAANEAQVRNANDAQASDANTADALHRQGREFARAGEQLTTATSESRMEITKAK